MLNLKSNYRIYPCISQRFKPKSWSKKLLPMNYTWVKNWDKKNGAQIFRVTIVYLKENSKIIYNYPPKGRWIVVHIYRDAKRRGIYPPLFTDPEGDSCFSIYQIRWIKKCFFHFFLLKLSRNDAPFFLPFAKQWIAKDIPSYGSQSKRAKIAIHWFGKY